MKKIVFFLSIVLCGQMCGNHIHNSRVGKIVDDKDSPSMEKGVHFRQASRFVGIFDF